MNVVKQAVAADADVAVRQHLRLALRADSYAVAIEEVREILEVGRITPMPCTPGFMRGVLNLRGAVVPIIDLAARLEQGASTIARRSCIVVVDVKAADGQRPHTVGLLVDAVFEVFDVLGDSLEPVPALGTAIAPRFLSGIARAQGQVVPVLNLAETLAPDALADLIAHAAPA